MPIYSSDIILDGTDIPGFRPALNLDFANSKRLGKGFKFQRDHTNQNKVALVNASGHVELVHQHTPRFTHDPMTGESLGLLTEPPLENYLIDSSNINNNIASNTNVAFNSSTPDVKDPGGGNRANKVTETTANGVHHFSFGGYLTYTGRITASIWARRGTRTSIRLHLSGGSNYGGSNPNINVDLTDGSLISASANVESYHIEEYPDNWYRITITAVSSGAQSSGFFVMFEDFASYAGSTSNYFYLWGPQLTRGWRTSYIETTGNTETGSSGDELVCEDASQFYCPTGGTWVIEAYGPRNNYETGTNHHLMMMVPSDNDQNKAYQIRFDGGPADIATWGSLTSVTDQWNFSSSLTYVPDQLYRIALRVKANDVRFFVDGVSQGGPDTSVSLRTDLTRCFIGSSAGFGQPNAGIIRSVKYYKEHFTDAQLAAVTTS